MPAGPQHPGELRHDRPQVGNVCQRRTADDEVHRVVGHGEPRQLAETELAVRHADTCQVADPASVGSSTRTSPRRVTGCGGCQRFQTVARQVVALPAPSVPTANPAITPASLIANAAA
ncbi:hypothetical protein YW7DRAFT_02432 [Streptomyces sp. AmelKG-E11A]|nr:hypothetical protein YW7DRAFT_02432 [Streptomyces sp. AmelKG-E11A]